MKKTTLTALGSLAGLSSLIAASLVIGQSGRNIVASTAPSHDPLNDFYGVRTASQTSVSTSDPSTMSVQVNGHAISVPENGSTTTTVPDPNSPNGNTEVHITVNNSTTPDSSKSGSSSSGLNVNTSVSSSTSSVNVNSNSTHNNQNSGFFSNTLTQNGKVISNTQQQF